jgi:hypothetical protein
MSSESKKAGSPEAELKCPECGQTGFKDRRAWGIHRYAKHGVRGTSPSTVKYHEKQEEKKKVSVTTPKKDHHKKEVIPTVTTPGEIAIVKKPEIPTIPPVLLGYAMGRLESLAAQIARENLLPEEEFIRVAAASLAELTKR